MESDWVVGVVMTAFINVLGGVKGWLEVVSQEYPGGAPLIWELDPKGFF
jgi:hypothetical protein